MGKKLIQRIEKLIATAKDGGLSLYGAGQLDSEGYVRELEEKFCDYLNVKHSMAMSSATSALHCACVFCEGEVITVSPLTFSASASCILMAGKKIRFADVDDTYNLNPEYAKELTIAVHLHGSPCDLNRMEGTIIEDCSQALGAKYKGKFVGTIGKCGVFSFNRWKHINSGQGGMLITNDDELARKVKLMRNHGEVVSDILGYNYLMTELDALVLLDQFEHIEEDIERRNEIAGYLSDRVPPVRVLKDCRHSYYTYPLKVSNRNILQKTLKENGYYFGEGGLKPLNLYPFYGGGYFPHAEDYYRNVMFTDQIKNWTKGDVDKITGIING